ncbi:MAG: hypothetical protein D3916_10515 [Candidatus Electrothrix sp. MAN1_4]|nr:hypothetical protein [Candidatus Electrothrix sp. MAN1_4]
MICGLLLLFGGMYHAYGGLKNSVPQQMTVAEFVTADPSSGAFVLTDARLNLLKALVMTEGDEKKIKKLYIPIESSEYLQEGKVHLLLESHDETLLRIASAFYLMDKEEQMKYVVHQREKLLQEMKLPGIVLDKKSMRASRLQEISSVVPNLADNFFLLRHHARVNLIRSLIISILGLFVLIFGLFRERDTDSSPESDSIEAAET